MPASRHTRRVHRAVETSLRQVSNAVPTVPSRLHPLWELAGVGFNPHPLVAATDGSVAVRVCNRLACGLQGLGPPVPINCPFPSSGARRQWSPPTLRAERLREKGDGEGGRQWLHPNRSVPHPEDPNHESLSVRHHADVRAESRSAGLQTNLNADLRQHFSPPNVFKPAEPYGAGLHWRTAGTASGTCRTLNRTPNCWPDGFKQKKQKKEE